MTDEDLDDARATEAARLQSAGGYKRTTVGAEAARLAREGWTPLVDPFLLEARKLYANTCKVSGAADADMYAASTLDGFHDDTTAVRNVRRTLIAGAEMERERVIAYLRAQGWQWMFIANGDHWKEHS